MYSNSIVLLRRVCLLVCVTLAISPVRSQWTGFVNNLREAVDFVCPGNEAIIGVASDYSRSVDDRRWEFLCGSGGGVAGVLTSCNLEATIIEPTQEVNYDCPGNAYIGGFQSTFDTASSDRRWRPYCCTRPRTALINCVQSPTWENIVGGLLNWTTPGDSVITGLETFFDPVVNDRRWRYHYCDIQVDCGDPGLPDNSDRLGDDFLFTDTVQYSCNSGYYQSSGDNNLTCLDTGLWNGTLPVCTECTDIANCEDIRCTDELDHECFRCQSENGTGYGESGYRNVISECQPLCSWLMSFCYPGDCMNGTDSCNCSQGFAGDDCLEITDAPTVMSCQTTIDGVPGQSASVMCLNVSDLEFVNFLPTQVAASWEAVYLQPNPLPRPPAYVTGFSVGLASLYVEANLYRAANPNLVVSSSTHECNNVVITSDSPQEGPLTCSVMDNDLSSHAFLHGDSFELVVYSRNGGFLDILNRDTYLTIKHYYNGSAVMGSNRYQLDLMPPFHCMFQPVPDSSCTQPLLDVGDELTVSNVTTVRWGGWEDSPAGVTTYMIDVYLLEDMGGEVRERIMPKINTSLHQDSGLESYSMTVLLPHDGPYSFVMQVSDGAGNLQYARRLLLFDAMSRLTVDSNIPLRATSAIPQTGYIWQNSSVPLVTVTGQGHFYNTNLQTSNWLAPVADFAGATIDSAYDHPLNDGQYPRSGTNNALGVLSLEYEIVIDQEGGLSNSSLEIPVDFSNQTTDISLESVSFDIAASDGDSARIWFKAVDFKDQEIYDSLVVHFDSSPPMVRDLWLEYNGETGLLLHGSVDLTTIVISFEAWDEHSGLWSLQWRIGTWFGGDDIGSGRVPLLNFTTDICTPGECLCNSLDHCYSLKHRVSPLSTDLTPLTVSHDTDYYITVVVTNWAYLQAELTQQITIDITPPLRGFVFDGDTEDIDYQQEHTVTAWWTGFFDRESSVMFYQYIFDTSCADDSVFAIPAYQNVSTTNGTTAMWTAPGEGTYHVTIVAFNMALRHSAPICSDGIIIDNTPPNFNTNSLVIAGKQFDSAAEISYIVAEYSLNISWSASDNFGVYDYLVGIASSELFDATPDLVSFHTTTRQRFISLHSSNLTSGQQFYVVITAEDHALLSATAVFGPIVLDTSPPVVNGTVSVDRENTIITVSWPADFVVDNEQVGPLTYYEYAIGRTPYGSEIQEFTSVDLTDMGDCPNDYYCVTIDTSSLQLLDDHTYYFPIRVTNAAGLSSMASSELYTHVSRAPAIGFVYDVDLSRMFDISSGRSVQMEDIDAVVTVDTISTRWDCCTDGVSYTVGLGSMPGLENIVNFTTPMDQGMHSFVNVSLGDYRMYYVTVVARNSFGSTTASSDGVMVIQTSAQDVQRQARVLDGYSSDRSGVVYQASLTHATARWFFPNTVTPFVSHYMWAVMAAVNGSRDQLVIIKDYENVGDNGQATAAGLSLLPNQLYISAVQACHLSDCLAPVYSSGFYIATAPVPSSISATYNPTTGAVQASWESFEDPRLAYYEWSISEEMAGNNLLLPWQRVTGDITTLRYLLDSSISYSPAQSLVFTLRGVNVAGLQVVTSTSIRWIVDGEEIAQDQVEYEPSVVYDVEESDVDTVDTMDWSQLEHYAVDLRDIDYVGPNMVLHAFWPRLRYQSYSWSVSENRNFAECDSPSSIACGSTIANFVTVDALNLTHGHTYYTCVWATIDNIIIPNTNSVPAVLTACSDGVTADLAPPTPACVQIIVPEYNDDVELGSADGEYDGRPPQDVACMTVGGFQASNSELVLKWDRFADVETTYHITAITHYEYAIGTVPGGNDVVDYTEVGVTSQAVLSDLVMTSGLEYYATIRGYDFVGSVAQATSMPVIVDTSPPSIDRLWIGGIIDHSLTSLDNVHVSWDPIVDSESGLLSIEWAIGSQPGWGDIIAWQQVSNISHSSATAEMLEVSDGQMIFVSVLAINRAGLSQVKSSFGYTVDTSPPVMGQVLDGAYGEDNDYLQERSSFSAHWVGFNDPHSDILEYEWAIGSCSGCTDVQGFVSVGLLTESAREGLSLKDGQKYYTTMRACNLAGLCTMASSNGAVVDSSPPIPGVVLDGLNGADIQFQSSRYHVTAHWMDFHDTHSGIAYYQFYSGSMPDSDDIVPPFIVDASQTSATIRLAIPLTPGSSVYTTLVAFNGAGLSVAAISDGIAILTQAPLIVDDPYIDVSWAGSLLSGTQYDHSLLRLVSNFTDHSNTINHYSWAVYSGRQIFLPISPFLSYVGDYATFTRIHLSDGQSYYAEVETCNAAGLCSRAATPSYLVDSTPPNDGYFAVRTSSAEQVVGRVETMTWRNNPVAENCRLRVYFTGFSDPHSGIARYYCSVGMSYSFADLTDGFKVLLVEQINSQGTYLANITLSRQLNLNEILYISLWAENGVGLNSRVAQGSFTLTSVSSLDGILELQRTSTCSIDSCEGHCTCAARGDLCDELPTCRLININDLPQDMHVNVMDITPQMIYTTDDGSLFTASSNKLAARWEVASPNTAQWFEWSVGTEGSPPGTGLLDVTSEQIWFNPGTNRSAIFTVSPQYPLITGERYTFHVRVWYNSTYNAVFSSAGVMVDQVGPQIVRGYRTREVSALGSTVDVDYINSASAIDLYWLGVFQAYAVRYVMAIGDTPAGYNIHDFIMLDSDTEMTVTGLSLRQGRLYYSTIIAHNPMGMRAVSISDGFIVDMTPPIAGTVMDGYLYTDRVAQFSGENYLVRWYGFVDQESIVDHYEIAIGEPSDLPATFINVGLNLRYNITGLSLTEGSLYHAYVVAVNQVGGNSTQAVMSNGLIIDSTRPAGVNCTQHSDNLFSNPSFDGPDVSNVHGDLIASDVALDSWQSSLSEVQVLSVNDLLAVDGHFSLFIVGSISQAVITIPNVDYLITFYLHRWNNNGDLLSGTITAPGLDRRFDIHPTVTTWTRISCMFTATANMSLITISTSGDNLGFTIDNVQVTYCINSSSIVASSPIISLPEAINIGLSSYLPSSTMRLYCNWYIEDGDSGIAEYLWAIGTTPGGDQLMRYTSTGSRSWAVSPVLHLRHNMSLFISVLAWNHAGLETLVQSGEYRVDLTPPVLDGSLKNTQSDLELSYQPAGALSVDWSDIVDYESGISYCLWAIGSSHGMDDLQPFTMVEGTTASNADLVPTSAVFITVTCTNPGLLYTTVTSDSIVTLSRPPDHNGASLMIFSSADSTVAVYGNMNNYLPTSSLILSWTGFRDNTSSHLEYEYRIIEFGGAVNDWVNVGAALQVSLMNISLTTDQEHQVEVRARNPAGLVSQPISRNFIVSMEIPVETGSRPNVTISPPNILIEWTGTFTSTIPLYYEVSFGKRMGSGSVVRWLETMDTSLQITDTRLSAQESYFLTLTAVSYAGLHTTTTEFVPEIHIP